MRLESRAEIGDADVGGKNVSDLTVLPFQIVCRALHSIAANELSIAYSTAHKDCQRNAEREFDRPAETHLEYSKGAEMRVIVRDVKGGLNNNEMLLKILLLSERRLWQENVGKVRREGFIYDTYTSF